MVERGFAIWRPSSTSGSSAVSYRLQLAAHETEHLIPSTPCVSTMRVIHLLPRAARPTVGLAAHGSVPHLWTDVKAGIPVRHVRGAHRPRGWGVRAPEHAWCPRRGRTFTLDRESRRRQGRAQRLRAPLVSRPREVCAVRYSIPSCRCRPFGSTHGTRVISDKSLSGGPVGLTQTGIAIRPRTIWNAVRKAHAIQIAVRLVLDPLSAPSYLQSRHNKGHSGRVGKCLVLTRARGEGGCEGATKKRSDERAAM